MIDTVISMILELLPLNNWRHVPIDCSLAD